MPVTLVLAALLLPPLAVFLDEGLTRNFWIAFGLTCLGLVPGVIFVLLLLIGKRRARARPA